jgi:hypothetical protein
MAISGPNFKMNKQSKRYLATILDPHKRGQIKRQLISAQIAAQIPVKRSKREG